MTTREPIYCDITELIANPVRTGIQRVVREVLRTWSSDRPLRLCRFDSSCLNLVEVPQEAIYYLIEPDAVTRRMSFGELQQRIALLVASSPVEAVPAGVMLLAPELFFDESRCRHYLWRMEGAPDRVHILFFDFIPWLHPEVIGVERGNHLMWYIRVAQACQRAGFISDATMRDWQTRIVRDPSRTGVVLPLGTDGLRLRRQRFSAEKRDFVTLGSIDGRKNQKAILAAFQTLWADGLDVSLTLVGQMFESERSVAALLATFADEPRFRHFSAAGDSEVTTILEGARATIYASTVEGYGLPPVESLAAGIPCIASRQVPSLEAVTGGLIALDGTSPAEIAAKVRLMADDVTAERIWGEAATLSLPTWEDFGAAVADWIN